ncbi:MAG: tRNA glutamyl-Q(34) synthetase GluQRS [Gammaproteobacteria bacterium]|nr:MAG: tRNA glutamyl-Q(34) synthetase GluQRS [Gammaproteobacteria bacterium]
MPNALFSTERSSWPLVNKGYRGRFAPSPSGLLHFGSLIAALASFLDAKSTLDNNNQQGKWLVRIDDIDPPREQAGASDEILKSLDTFGLHWDEQVLYQSQQTQLYNEVLANLAQQKLTYNCHCTRAQIKTLGGIYQGTCKTLNLSNTNNAVRLINQVAISQFNDLIQGQVNCDFALAHEDFILKRKDGLFAYQLAVVVDDIEQNITHVIRGCDLLEPTARQLSFFATLKQTPPQYGHVPAATTAQGFKLSKQNKAPAINNHHPQPALIAALKFLGQQVEPDMINVSVDEIITWAIKHWQRDNISSTTKIVID